MAGMTREQTIADVRAILKRMNSPWSDERRRAEEAFRRLGQDGVEALLVVIAAAVRRGRPARRIWIGLLLGILAALFVLSTGLLERVGIAGLILQAVMRASCGTRRQTNALQLLTRLDALQTVGPLCELLVLTDGEAKALIMAALERLLPRMQASDAGLLTDHQRLCLYRAVRDCVRGEIIGLKRVFYGDPMAVKFALPVLKALEQVGDEKAIPYVDALARWIPMNRGAVQIQGAAQECLRSLQDRRERDRPRQTLLRPAGPPGTLAETLLRPARTSEKADPSVLLRPVHSEAAPGDPS